MFSMLMFLSMFSLRGFEFLRLVLGLVFSAWSFGGLVITYPSLYGHNIMDQTRRDQTRV